jgi:ATP-dependent DNA helicase RecG
VSAADDHVLPLATPALGRLKATGAQAWPDLVFYLPRRYKDYSSIHGSFRAAHSQSADAKKACLALTVISRSTFDQQGNRLHPGDPVRPFRIALKVADGAGEEGWMNVFGNVFPWKGIVPGARIHVAGEVSVWNGKWNIRNPEIIPEQEQGRLVAVYPQKPGYLTSSAIAKGISYALDHYLSDAVAVLCNAIGQPEAIIDRLIGFPGGLRGVLTAIHRPASLDMAKRALARVRCLVAMQLLALAEQTGSRPTDPRSALPIDGASIRSLAAALPFPLTSDQRTAINEIVVDLRADRPMRRLLTGDVGCGKSICFQLPAAACQRIGRKVAILAPNQLIAEQLAREFVARFPGTPVEAVTAERKPQAASLECNPILIGTTALLAWAKTAAYTPDFLVVDEQHKHSRELREALAGEHTNLLEATATPIPRSLALVTHGGMDVSTIKEAPVAKTIETRVVTGIEEERLVDFVRRAVAGNWQVAVVYGRVEDDEDSDVRSIDAELHAWEKRFPGRVGVVHGRMKEAEKEAVLRRMRSHEISVLVSSTVIELGLTLPSLRAMVVVNAEMFGLSTLHQLRGRVARDGGRGKFLMFLPKDVSQAAQERLNALVETNDGFALAEMDMAMRGFGDLSSASTEQTGTSDTLFAGLTVTPSDLEEARRLLAAATD